MNLPIIDVIIPCYNEAESIVLVLGHLPKNEVRYIFVCDNNSTDDTAKNAAQHGAIVIPAPQRGYGSACLAGMSHIAFLATPPDIIVFLDGDYSDYPEQLPEIVKPIITQDIDMVIGSRALGVAEAGSMTLPQIFGNWLSAKLLRLLYGYRFTDLGPFRAIKYTALMRLNMADLNYGWTVEMQVKAAKLGLRCTEVPVNYRRRSLGVSKVSGSIVGSIKAGYKILWVIFKYAFRS